METQTIEEEVEKQIINKIREIEDVVDREWKKEEAISLMTGLSGVPLFYAQMDRWSNEISRTDKIYHVLEKVFEQLNKGNFIMTYSSGIIGVAFMLNLLQKENKVSRATQRDAIARPARLPTPGRASIFGNP